MKLWLNYMNKLKPLTLKEVEDATLEFFPLLNAVMKEMPKDSTMEDTLNVMEAVCKLAHKRRELEPLEDPFGFNKTP